MGTLVGIVITAVGFFLWAYVTGSVIKYGPNNKDSQLSLKIDPTARLEVAGRQPGCIGDVTGCLWWIILIAFGLFVVFYVLPEIGPAVRLLRDLK